MHNRKLFPPLPDFARDDPRSIPWRVDRLEEFLEDEHHHRLSNTALQGLFAPSMVLLVEILSAASLVSPAVRESVLKMLGQ